MMEFQSTLPMRGAADVDNVYRQLRQISIHAPHAGSGQFRKDILSQPLNFNPRSPCGERPLFGATPAEQDLFQSTLPMRGAAYPWAAGRTPTPISIHAPHAGSGIMDILNDAGI